MTTYRIGYAFNIWISRQTKAKMQALLLHSACIAVLVSCCSGCKTTLSTVSVANMPSNIAVCKVVVSAGIWSLVCELKQLMKLK